MRKYKMHTFGKVQRRKKVKVISDETIGVKIDEKTIIFVKVGTDIKALKKKYLDHAKGIITKKKKKKGLDNNLDTLS